MIYTRKVIEERWNSLLDFHKQLDLQEALKDMSDMKNMLLCRSGKKQDVVKVHEHKPVKHVPKHVINQSLEISGGVGESK